MNEEGVDNILIESLKLSPTRSPVPSKVKITYPANISFDKEEEESDDEPESLSPKLGSIATKSSTKTTATSTSKGSVQT